ncbi:MAG: hypothetical protein UR18_C0006G0030 [Candidatus Nomurabacteria bacterium GW2011_GWE2_31_40]|nr:MAG: hypothetical protein UR18_C0006G0030 [Candidatus Nomurabacteria bacterium GW2011_GWE2_31_40]
MRITLEEPHSSVIKVKDIRVVFSMNLNTLVQVSTELAAMNSIACEMPGGKEMVKHTPRLIKKFWKAVPEKLRRELVKEMKCTEIANQLKQVDKQ